MVEAGKIMKLFQIASVFGIAKIQLNRTIDDLLKLCSGDMEIVISGAFTGFYSKHKVQAEVLIKLYISWRIIVEKAHTKQRVYKKVNREDFIGEIKALKTIKSV